MLEEIFFKDPIFFWLLLFFPIIIAWFVFVQNKMQPILKISSIKGFKSSSNFILRNFRLLPFIIRMFTLFLIVFALARPQSVDVSTRTKTNKGIDIVMAIDISSSMLAQDLKPDRLTALKRVASAFIDDRISDRIGLVVYAGESYTKTPITSDKGVVKKTLGEISYQKLIDDGTAIGMGLATSVNRLKDSPAKSKVIILLTDGVNNSGFIDPKIATELAVEYGIKTYTIGLGSNGNAKAPVGILPNGKFKYGITKVEIDEELLKTIANSTGGLYFRATDNKKLQEIYQEINKLEKTEIQEFKYYNYDEKYRKLIFLAIGFIFLEWFIKSTFLKSFI